MLDWVAEECRSALSAYSAVFSLAYESTWSTYSVPSQQCIASDGGRAHLNAQDICSWSTVSLLRSGTWYMNLQSKINKRSEKCHRVLNW